MQLTYYAASHPDIANYYLQGFAELESSGALELKVTRKVPERLQSLLGRGNSYVSLYTASISAESVLFAIDGRDVAGIKADVLNEVDLYFKVNYDSTKVAGLSSESARRKVQPCLPSFPITLEKRRFRPRSHPQGNGLARHVSRYIEAYFGKPTTVSLAQLRELREVPKTHDVAFVVPYYDQSHHTAQNEFRFQVMSLLSTATDIDSIFGFVGNAIPEPYSRFQIARVPMDQHLQRLAASRVGVYVHGVHDCISFKFGELLSLGLPIVGQRIPRNRNRLEFLPFFDKQFHAQSPEELVEGIRVLCEQEALRREIEVSNARVFDRELVPIKAAGEIASVLAASSGRHADCHHSRQLALRRD